MANFIQIAYVLETTIAVKAESGESVKCIVPVSGASMSVAVRAGGTGKTTVYGNRTGSSTVASPKTNTLGAVPYWLEEGSYTLTFTGGAPTVAGVEIDLDAVSEAQVNGAYLPIGSIIPYAGTGAVPVGFLFCDGSAVAKATYPNLYTAIGTTFGGNSTNFGLPDLRGRAPVGADNFGTKGAAGRLTANNKIGESSGAQSVSLTIAQLAAHKHSVTDSGHTHSIAVNLSQSPHGHGQSPHAHGPGKGFSYLYWDNVGVNINAQYHVEPPLRTQNSEALIWGVSEQLNTGAQNANIEAANANVGISSASASTSSTGVSTNNEGTGEAHPNMSPYQACAYIIKY